ncbi:MAG: VgrG-related protein [Dehalococcoidales bacterium]|nr:VgrG-related protein [Dehalococcoidales bacterium]
MTGQGDDHISQVYITVDGTDVQTDLMRRLVYVEVDDNLLLPDMFVMCFHDQHVELIDSQTFALGKLVEIRARTSGGPVRLMNGEVTSLEPSFDTRRGPTLVVRGYDLAHRLHRGRKTRTFVQHKDSDIVQRVARECGLRVQVDATSEVHEYVIQDNQTDLEFLLGRARRVGYLLYVEDGVVNFRRTPPPPPQAPRLEWGVDLRELRVRVSAAEQVNEVVVRAWDPQNRSTIIGRATQSQVPPQVGQERQGGQAAQQAYQSQARQVIVNRIVQSQAEADTLAQAVHDEISGSYIRAEGACRGNPQVAAGATVNLVAIGNRYSGQYTVTRSLHRFDLEGYVTRFTVSGRRSDSLLELVRGPGDGRRDPGVVVGVVTDNTDPQGQARVRVSFPWLDDSQASAWARLVTPMAGDGRGIEFIPEVNDEVLVAFEHGDMNRPLVLGALWNGQDAPPQSSSDAVVGGQVNKRIIRSRAGHEITLDDTNDRGSITIVDSTGNNRITIDSVNNSLAIAAQGDVTIESQGQLTIRATRGIEIDAGGGQVEIKGSRISLN